MHTDFLFMIDFILLVYLTRERESKQAMWFYSKIHFRWRLNNRFWASIFRRYQCNLHGEGEKNEMTNWTWFACNRCSAVNTRLIHLHNCHRFCEKNRVRSAQHQLLCMCNKIPFSSFGMVCHNFSMFNLFFF